MRDYQVLLMGGADNTYHNFDRLLPILSGLLETIELDVTVSDDPDMFLPDRIQGFDLIVCYTFGPTLSPDQEEGLMGAVRGDPWHESARTKGFIGIHGAACSFLNSEAYLRMLGGKFLVHPPLDTLDVEIIHPEHTVMQGIRDFSIKDELYVVEPYTPFETLAVCDYEGFLRPIVWVKPYGLGKVVYLSLGHGARQLKHEAFQDILLNAALWILEA